MAFYVWVGVFVFIAQFIVQCESDGINYYPDTGTPGAAGTPMSGNRSVLDELRRLRQSKTEQDAKLVKVQNALEREREANKSLQKALQLVENQQRSRMLMRR